jgi:hypothetical protein
VEGGEKGFGVEDIPAAVCEEVVVPALEFMGAPDGIEDVLAWLEAEMVCVVET